MREKSHATWERLSLWHLHYYGSGSYFETFLTLTFRTRQKGGNTQREKRTTHYLQPLTLEFLSERGWTTLSRGPGIGLKADINYAGIKPSYAQRPNEHESEKRDGRWTQDTGRWQGVGIWKMLSLSPCHLSPEKQKQGHKAIKVKRLQERGEKRDNLRGQNAQKFLPATSRQQQEKRKRERENHKRRETGLTATDPGGRGYKLKLKEWQDSVLLYV